MTIKIEYGPLIIKKMKRVVDRAYEAFPVKKEGFGKDVNRQSREEYVREKTGMQLGYLTSCGPGPKQNREPSGRVINNMGIEVWFKDLETGEMELQKVIGRCEIDHYQQTSPASTSD